MGHFTKECYVQASTSKTWAKVSVAGTGKKSGYTRDIVRIQQGRTFSLSKSVKITFNSILSHI